MKDCQQLYESVLDLKVLKKGRKAVNMPHASFQMLI